MRRLAEQIHDEDVTLTLRLYKNVLDKIADASEAATDAIHTVRLPLLRSRKMDREILQKAKLGYIFEDFEDKVNVGDRIAELDGMTNQARTLASEIDDILEKSESVDDETTPDFGCPPGTVAQSPGWPSGKPVGPMCRPPMGGPGELITVPMDDETKPTWKKRKSHARGWVPV